MRGGVNVNIPVDEGRRIAGPSPSVDGNDKLALKNWGRTGYESRDVAMGLRIDNGLKNVAKTYGHRGYLTPTIRESNRVRRCCLLGHL